MKTIKLVGDVGIKMARRLCDSALATIEAGPDCVVDFSEARRVDCSVAQVLLALRRECERRGGNCLIRNVNDEMARLLECAGLKRGA
ncbi:MAG: STAS domain-containing protein [Spirochaetes bacterium]|nr:STAS domain-containing protein [Spirochaetota bacterium]